METIRTAEQCVHAEMIAWVSYPAYKKFCFVYPRYLLESNVWKAIEGSAFPNNGSFFAAITGGSDSSEIQSKFGMLVIARVNAAQFGESNSYDPLGKSSTFYQLQLNPTFTKGSSDLEFELFSEHSISAELVQVVGIKDNVSFIKPFDTPITISDGADDLVCKLILAKNASGLCFGPFGYSRKDNGAITLIAPSSNDYRVGCLGTLEPNATLPIYDEYGVKRFEFIEKRTVDAMYKKAENNDDVIDWMPQAELVDIVTRAINASDEFSGLGKSQLRNIKNAVRNFNDNTGKLKLDEARKQRVIDWLSQIDNWTHLPAQVINQVIDSVADEKILELVRDERYFPLFKDKIIEDAGIQDSIAEERRKLESVLSDIKHQCGVARETQAIAEQEAREANDKVVEARRQLEKVRDEALAQKREELNEIEKDIENHNAELKRLEEEYERAIVSKNKIEKDVEGIIGGINDEIATSTKILESEILRKVVAAVSGVDFHETDQEPLTEYAALRMGEDEMTDDEIVEFIYDAINQRANRQITRNDTVNLMVCLTQGYITTFSGLPGTGKTSLCNILAGVLGLTNDDAGRRFTEINVENGWTSYRDYVGYYNPLAKSYEKANPSVYDAMRLLSKEQSNVGGIPPYVFLLDEANLSPIEHYWAPFLRACDSFWEDGASFTLGGVEKWCLPNHVRFLATVNYDHTTETLSHRFLDRSWVITLDPDFIDFDFDQSNINKVFASEEAFSSSRLFRAFDCKETGASDQDNVQLLDDLVRICRMHSFAISPRSQLMMRRYIASASRLMSLRSKDSQYAPLDYAFSQKVLPQIVGPEERVGELIEDLSDKCSQLKTTKKQLERMKEFGKDSGFYQYFI